MGAQVRDALSRGGSKPPAIIMTMPDGYLSDDSDQRERLVRALVAVVLADPPPLPEPGRQAAWRAVLSAEPHPGIEHEASDALRDLLDRGATQQEIYALARGIAAQTIVSVLGVLDQEGELSGEFYYAVDQIRGPKRGSLDE